MIGKTISHYTIIEKLGEGGMGVVYKAEDIRLKRPVALKFLPAELTRDHEAKDRFIHEARAASSLDHPNICAVHEIDETEDGLLFIVMAYYDGETLKKRIEREPLNIDEAYDLAIQIARGLGNAHGNEIVHRDLKPANIIVTRDGIAKIVDFGLAKLARQTKLTKTGSTLGTVAYMSPEQAKGEETDLRADIWALGVVLYEMISGQLPFKSEYEQAIIYSILNCEPPPILEMRKDTTPELAGIIAKCLKKNPEDRYMNAAELEEDLVRASKGLELLPALQPKKGLFAARSFFRVPRRPVLLATVILAVFASLLLFPSIREPIQKWAGMTIIPEEKYLAILPFTNIGADPASQAFCDGLVETLTSKLTQLQLSRGSLWIVAASEIRERGIESVGEARKAFGVTLGITGSVQRERNQIRLTLNLVDAVSARQLRSTVADEWHSSLTGLQDKAALSIAEMLQLELNPGELRSLSATGTSSAKAFDYYTQARGYLQRFEKMENIDIAISLFEKAAKEDAEYALAFAGLGEAFWRKFELSKDTSLATIAVKHCDRALELDDKLAPPHITLGLIFKGTGKYEEAVREFNTALTVDPVNSDAFRGLAAAYERLGDVAMAEKTYQKAIEFARTYWAGYNRLGVFYYRQGRYEDAAQQFRRVVELTPDNFRGYNNLGGLYFYMNRWKEAEKQFEKSIAVEPNYVAYSQLGTLYYFRREFHRSADVYERALQYQKTDYRVWGNLGMAHFWSSDTQKAKAAFEEAVKLARAQIALNPRDGILICDLAGYYEKLDRKQEALHLVEKALALAPNNVEVFGRAGVLYEILGDRKTALKWIEKAVRNGYTITEFENEPELADLWKDEEFKRIIEKR